jgi:DNA-binding winged helix-turn-helix (wHTH) protein/tetratricopeptide (TPR) repeat protein
MPGSFTSPAGYQFGRFWLSADGTLLRREGAVVPLAPKVLQTLLVLVEHGGTVVKKADLLEAVWPDSFVEETGLSRNISLLRDALGDEAQQLIATVPRVGYRFAAPVERVAGGPKTRARPPRRRDQPIVGRATQLHALRDALNDARKGQGSLVALAGEPGIGKTTLADTFLDEVGGSCRVGTGRCSERLAGVEPHLPVLEALEELAADPAVHETLRRRASTWSRYLASDEQGADADAEAPGTSATGSPERLMRELTRFLEDTSRERPIIIAIDDVQWADASTVDALSHLAPRLAEMHLLVLVTYRLHELELPGNPFAHLRTELIARGQLREVPVTLLQLDDVQEYIRAAFGDLDFPPDLPAFVLRKTEGNPLFITDLVRYLRDGDVRPDSERPAHEVPDSLRALIDRMLQRLPPDAHQLLSLAAVQGYEFDSATLARVSGSAPAAVEDLLRSADRAHALVALVGETELPDGSVTLVHRFVHVLYQDALYASTTPSRRIEWARRIAEALVTSHAGHTGSIAGQLAVLFETGREFWQASRYFLDASRDAVRLFAFGPASELAGRGLECLWRAQDIDSRDRLGRELDLTFARLVPFASLRGYAAAETEQLTTRVVQLAEDVGDPAASAAALTATWFVRMSRGECRRAREVGERLAAIGRANGDDVLLINGHMNAQIACHHLGEFQQAAAHADAVSALAIRVTPADRCIGVLDPIGASVAESSRNHLITGYLSRALAECERAVVVGRELAHPDSLAFAWLFHGWIHGYRGDWRTALASVDAGAAVARESGSVQTLAWNRCVRGWALAHLGDTDAGCQELASGIEASCTIMGEVSIPQFGAMMAEALLLRNEAVAAEEWLRRAHHVGNANDDRYFAADVHRLLATCLTARGDRDRARAELLTALDVAQSQGAMFFELRAALMLAEHDLTDGRDALRAVLGRFPEPEPWLEVRAAQRILANSRLAG